MNLFAVNASRNNFHDIQSTRGFPVLGDIMGYGRLTWVTAEIEIRSPEGYWVLHSPAIRKRSHREGGRHIQDTSPLVFGVGYRFRRHYQLRKAFPIVN